MIAEIKAIEPQLKQILYECVEYVQATKAALYLSASHDLNEMRFEIVTSYQYNATDRKIISGNDDLVDRLSVKRNAFFVNGLASDQRFAEMMFKQGNDRLLATPIFARGRLLGFIDMRDKAGKKPFEIPDLDAARKIAEEMLQLLSAKNLYGLAAVPVIESGGQNLVEPAAVAAAVQPIEALKPGQVFSAQAALAVESAREVMTRRQHAAISTTGKRILSEGDIEVVRLLLPSALAIPGAVLAALTVTGHPKLPQAAVALATVSDDALEMLQTHLRRASQDTTITRAQISHPLGVQAVPVTAPGISTMLSAPVNAQLLEGVVLTVAFERIAEGQAQRALQIFLRQIEHSVETAINASSGRTDRQVVAERLLEPDFQRYPDLVEHCREVAVIAHRFAKLLELPAPQVENIRLAAMVHDIGMRLLDYERLYTRPQLSPDEIRGLGEHPIIGAAIVEPLLGPDVALIVLRHHERVDGTGYPSRMSGQQIPLGARVVQIADAWIAMTSNQSYRTPTTRDDAVARLRDGAGTQFDGDLVRQFIGSLSELTGA